MNAKQVKEGSYRYKRPHWENVIPVTVVEIDGELFVKLTADSRYPSRLQNIPADAIFEYND